MLSECTQEVCISSIIFFFVCLQLSAADFRNNEALETLLPLLEKTFSEFKTHEHIENQFIMERLKQRLKIMNVTCHAVCNCHKDNDLVEVSFLKTCLR